MTTLLLSLPAWALLVLFMLVSAAIGVGVHLAFRRLKPLRLLRSHLDVSNALNA